MASAPLVYFWFGIEQQHCGAGVGDVVPSLRHRDGEVYAEVLLSYLAPVYVQGDGLAFRPQTGLYSNLISAQECSDSQGAPGAIAPPQFVSLTDYKRGGSGREGVGYPDLGLVWMKHYTVVLVKFLQGFTDLVVRDLELLCEGCARRSVAFFYKVAEDSVVQAALREIHQILSHCELIDAFDRSATATTYEGVAVAAGQWIESGGFASGTVEERLGSHSNLILP